MSSVSQRTYEIDEPLEKEALISYLLYLADNALILAHRNSEWCGHGPALELDIALTNIALDLLGQARSFYQYAAGLINDATVGLCHGMTTKVTEDTLAYHRAPHQFFNCLLAEQPKGDWGVTVARQFLFSVYQYYLYNHLRNSSDQHIAAIAVKALKEVTYHVRWSSEWLIRLGAGTSESHARMLAAVTLLKPFIAELFTPADYETVTALAGIGVNVTNLQPLWQQKIEQVFTEATLQEALPLGQINTTFSGKNGQHTEHLEPLLTEMQHVQRTHPGAEW